MQPDEEFRDALCRPSGRVAGLLTPTAPRGRQELLLDPPLGLHDGVEPAAVIALSFSGVSLRALHRTRDVADECASSILEAAVRTAAQRDVEPRWEIVPRS